MRLRYISLIGSVLFGLAFVAEAETGQVAAACSSLERPNIDCACVAQRAAVFERVSPSPKAKTTIVQGYLHAVGQPNTYSAALEDLMSDQMAAIMAIEAYDTVGGQPSNISDYESGCVIADAKAIEIESGSDAIAVKDYVAACTASTGDERFCQCDANRKASHVSDLEFEAYFRSFSDYSDRGATTREDLSQSRGKAMGLSAEAFDEIQASARTKINASSEIDRDYCGALTWADKADGVSADARLNAGFEPGLAARLAPRGDLDDPATTADRPQDDSGHGSRLDVARPADTAHGIVKQSCTEQGNSASYCSCYLKAFDAEVVQVVDTPETALAWALMNSAGAGVSSAEYMSLTQSIPQSSHEAAGMMMMQTMDLGSQCTQGESAKASGLTGTPSERMMQICVAENEDEALCGCAVEKMQVQFPPDDFELLVDIREAEHLGAEDPLAEVAAQRGLNRSEAESALENNPVILSGMMSMGASMMQCMGGIPAMPNLPGMPQQ